MASVWNLVVGVLFRNLTYLGVFLGSCSWDLLIILRCFVILFSGEFSYILQWQWHVLSLPLDIWCSLSLSCSIVWCTVYSALTTFITFGVWCAAIFNFLECWALTLNLILLRSIYLILLASWLLNNYLSKDLSSNCLCLLSLFRIRISLLIASARDVASVGYLDLIWNFCLSCGSLCLRVTLEESDGILRKS